MRSIYFVTVLSLVATIAAASLKSDAAGQYSILLARHASGCTHSTTWQDDDENSMAPNCNHGTSLSILDTSSLVNKTHCEAVVHKLSSKVGAGHWNMQWDCDEGSPDRLSSSGGCVFTVDNVTTSHENT